MQRGHLLEFSCLGCSKLLVFSAFTANDHCEVNCSHCPKVYSFDDPVLLRQLKKFTDLCRQIHDSEEILAQTSVGINVGSNHVSVPFKLLLTRFDAEMKLNIGGVDCTITSRIEPVAEISKTL